MEGRQKGAAPGPLVIILPTLVSHQRRREGAEFEGWIDLSQKNSKPDHVVDQTAIARELTVLAAYYL